MMSAEVWHHVFVILDLFTPEVHDRRRQEHAVHE